MSTYMYRELLLFVKALGCGAILVLGYDFFRVWRRVIKHQPFWVVAEDLLYWIVSSLFLSFCIYRENNGVLRGYFFIGLLLGGMLWHFLVGERLVCFAAGVLKRLKEIFRILTKKILFPIKRLKFLVLRCRIFLYEVCKQQGKSSRKS